jgi:hypothetical protein
MTEQRNNKIRKAEEKLNMKEERRTTKEKKGKWGGGADRRCCSGEKYQKGNAKMEKIRNNKELRGKVRKKSC